MAKQIKHGNEARQALINGVDQLADTVKIISYVGVRIARDFEL